jgi:hypothetical protein
MFLAMFDLLQKFHPWPVLPSPRWTHFVWLSLTVLVAQFEPYYSIKNNNNRNIGKIRKTRRENGKQMGSKNTVL